MKPSLLPTAQTPQGASLPAAVAPALVDFANATANVPFTLARESLELHYGMAAKALGVGKAFLTGGNSSDMLDLGTKLMAFDWPAVPNFAKVRRCQRVPCPILSRSQRASRMFAPRPHTVASPLSPQLYDTVSKAVKAVPADVMKDVQAVAPACIHRCCKKDVALVSGTARASAVGARACVRGHRGGACQGA